MNLPSAIIFVNSDLDGYNINTLVKQLKLDGYMSKIEFDNRISVLPSYPDLIHINNYRVMIILPDLHDHVNREFADVVIFVKAGLASILKNKFGPPDLTLPIERLNIYELLRGASSTQVVILPNFNNSKYQQPKCDCAKYGLGGIFAIESSDTTGIHLPNCDNLYNNINFINRKS